MASSSSKIHLFKKSAIEAGTPEDYYLDPSDNLWKITSAWRVVEHEDYLVLTVKLLDIGDLVFFGPEPELNEIQIAVALENKEKAARFEHKDGIMVFRTKTNPKFLKKIDCKDDAKPLRGLPDGTAKLLINKLKLKKELSAVRISALDE